MTGICFFLLCPPNLMKRALPLELNAHIFSSALIAIPHLAVSREIQTIELILMIYAKAIAYE